MTLVASDRSPADQSSVSTATVKLSLKWGGLENTNIYDARLYRRVNGGSWTYTQTNPGLIVDFWTHEWTITIAPLSRVEWYGVAYHMMPGGELDVTLSPVWTVFGAADTTDPTITSVTPATGNVTPGAGGVTFQASVADNIALANAKLYVDGDLKQTWTTAGTKSRTESLTKGAHTYRWTAQDSSGNTADTGTVNITVQNMLPTVPSGTISVGGQTGAVQVANLGYVWLSWPAFIDGNPEDTLTYTVDYKIGAGEWTQIATGISGLSVEWHPDGGLGAAELRVKANDGTGDSGYLSRASISVVSSQSPNAPTLTAPAGAEEWREGETHTIEWTPASPEHPEGLPCVYEIQFSKSGNFSDAVVLTTSADGGSYSWTLDLSLVTSDTGTCKVRIRASDGYSKTSDWDTSDAFEVQQNAAPVVTLVSPTADELVSGNMPYVVALVTDADSDTLHLEYKLSLRPDLEGGYYLKSALGWENWERASDPFESWSALPEAGATTGQRIRHQTPPLRYDIYYLSVRAFDGILCSDWSDPISFRVTPSGDLPVSCSIGAYSYNVMGLRATERTGGEASPFDFRVPLSILATQPIVRGSSVSIGLSIGSESRVWNGTVENLLSEGAEVLVQCVMDDAYLARKLVAGDEASDDVGTNLAAFVDDYGTPLTSDHIDTDLGVDAALTGGYKSLLDHLREWAQILGLILWVDSDGEVHLEKPADLPDPQYILYEGYE